MAPLFSQIPTRPGRSPNLLTLLDPSQPIFYTTIFEHLNPVDTVNLLATCRQTRSLKKHVFNVNVLLRPFFKDPVQFRQVMADNDLIVGGSMALRLFSRERWKSTDIDVYTESHESVPAVASFLEGEGYRFQPYFWQTNSLEETLSRRDRVKPQIENPFAFPATLPHGIGEVEGSFYGIEQIKDIYAFVQEETEKKIEVVLTRGSFLGLVLSYYATFLMNFFTYRTAFSLFPSGTFRDKKGFYVPPSSGLRSKTKRGVLKYESRGYHLHTIWTSRWIREKHVRIRAIGDCDTWCLPLCTNGISIPAREQKLQGARFSVVLKRGSWVEHLDNDSFYEWKNRDILGKLPQSDHLKLKTGEFTEVFP
ncbi:hypothetical protein TWF481_003092 [Arthrobotrys musiformis]|uniref:F-box domain-containing protein n=1 Tax=Arthrobotrys musiformis TaxID=47236 RepID=A0AAV9VP91_9PEZI